MAFLGIIIPFSAPVSILAVPYIPLFSLLSGLGILIFTVNCLVALLAAAETS